MTEPLVASNRVIVDVSPSLDGYVAGDGVSVDRPFGTADLSLYRWLGLGGTEPGAPDREAAEWQLGDAGAILLGRTMFDVGIGPWGPDGAFRRPCFVVTSRPREPLTKGPTTFSFVPDLPTGLDAARQAAGDQAVMIVGGANLINQCLAAGVVDEVRLHVAPTLLGSGPRLFDPPRTSTGQPTSLELIDCRATPLAVHLRYAVNRLPATGD